eukprot:g12741.t1
MHSFNSNSASAAFHETDASLLDSVRSGFAQQTIHHGFHFSNLIKLLKRVQLFRDLEPDSLTRNTEGEKFYLVLSGCVGIHMLGGKYRVEEGSHSQSGVRVEAEPTQHNSESLQAMNSVLSQLSVMKGPGARGN